MKKYISIVILAFLMFGCSEKTEIVTPKIDTPSVTKEVTPSKKEVKTLTEAPALPAGFVEKKALKPLDPMIPPSCKEWSDGCNTCTRANRDQASCTLYTCENKGAFSCLRWE